MARFAPVLATVVALLVAVSAGRQPVNNRPVIGILSQPSPDDLPGNHANYLAASYVKFIEGTSPFLFYRTKKNKTYTSQRAVLMFERNTN